jgi:hypothetical protein
MQLTLISAGMSSCTLGPISRRRDAKRDSHHACFPFNFLYVESFLLNIANDNFVAFSLINMPAATMITPAKRVLQETTNIRHLSPQDSSKKRKLDKSRSGRYAANGDQSKLLSSQAKSQFEQHLEQLSQNINGLKELNAERDQQWARPDLVDFDPAKHDLTFQQIEAEEGTLSGGKQTIRLFGVTEVSALNLVYILC